MKNLRRPLAFAILLVLLTFLSCSTSETQEISLEKESRIVLIGNNLGSRMINFGHFETEMHLRYPDYNLFIRNMCDAGNTPGFRPHSGRPNPWAFPGAEKYHPLLDRATGSEGTFETEDQWLSRLEADIVVAFFGFNESFEGEEGLNDYKNELNAFIAHTLKQRYNGTSAPQLVIVSPIAFQDSFNTHDLPDGVEENKNLELYTEAMKEVSQQHNVLFVDVFNPSKNWFSKEKLTIDGTQLNDRGYQNLAVVMADKIFGEKEISNTAVKEELVALVKEKNFHWLNDFKIPNGVHVFGRRYDPYGPDNYPFEIEKTRQLTQVRDTAIWATVKGERFDMAKADAATTQLPPVATNYTIGDPEDAASYLYGKKAEDTFKVPPGYKIELFASEEEFPDLANPAQISFDNKGRLWVATLPSYPHYKPGDKKPSDKLLILEDTDNDGKADKQTIFADDLHLPIGFEFAPEGVYVSQSSNLKLYSDTDGDDKADTVEIVLSGFDDHDSHHAISAFCADPSGAFYMSEGTFLHSNIETSYGPVRASNGGFYRFNPAKRKLERTVQASITNPWGTAFDEWGQDFFLNTSDPRVEWMMPSTLKPIYGVASPLTENLIEKEHQVRPTSGLEFVSSRHFPEEVQGDMLLCNTIGFLGIKQHKITENGTGYATAHRQDLLSGTDTNFRPVDIEFAPDGSLYLVDWHNVLIGHMQHNARDPLRDHVHGRIYRITYPSRPLVEPAPIDGAPIATLLENLKLPEYRTRYRTRRELRGRDQGNVLAALSDWTKNLDPTAPKYEHHLLEALWVSWGLNAIDTAILEQLLNANDHRVRSAAVRALRYNTDKVDNYLDLFKIAASDDHGRVRLEAITAASWLDKAEGLDVLEIAGTKEKDRWTDASYEFAKVQLKGAYTAEAEDKIVASHLKGDDLKVFSKGKKIYETEGYCVTCHQESGSGLQASGYPTLVDQNWVVGSKERLIKLALHGLYGPMDVMGNHYEGQVPMMAFKGLLNDEEIAAVLTYVRNAFGNKASVIKPEEVQKIREETKDRNAFYTADELLEVYPLE